VGIEANQGVILGWYVQRFSSDVFKCEQNFGAVGEQQIHIRPRETNHYFGIFEAWVEVLTLSYREGEVEARVLNNHA